MSNSRRHRRAMRSRPTERPGASLEVIQHHIQLHGHSCEGRGAIQTPCPCGTTLVVGCGTCREPVFIVVAPGAWCSHAEELVPTMESR